MPFYEYGGLRPVVPADTFVHPTASLIGDVIVGSGCYIGPGASLRGDFGRIVVGDRCSVQDSVSIHTTSDRDCVIGFGCTIAHNVVLHGCTIGDHTLVGMGSVVLDGVRLGHDSLVAALSLVTSGQSYPERSLVRGHPAVMVRQFDEDDVSWQVTDDHAYVQLARRSLNEFVECEPLCEVQPDRVRHQVNAFQVEI